MRLHLYLRGSVWWCRGSDGGVKFRRSTKHTNKGKASLVRDRWERELADPAHFRAHQATVASACERWEREIRTGMNPETVRFYAVKASHVLRLLGDVRLSAISHDRVLRYITDREAEGGHTHTIHRELTTLRLILKSAQRAKEFAGDPKATIPKYRTGYVPRTDWRTPEELWAVIAELDQNRGAAVAYCVATASDYSPLFTSRRADVEAKVIHVRGTKTGNRKRQVPRVKMLDVFVRHALAYGGEDLLFEPWTNMPRDLERACKRAGVPKFTARTLRRSVATWMVKAGVPYEVVAKFMGHAGTAMLFRVYGVMAPEDVGGLIDQRLGTVSPVYPDTQSGQDSADREER